MKVTSVRQGNKVIEVNKQDNKYEVVSFLDNEGILKQIQRMVTTDADKAFEIFRLMVDTNGTAETQTETV